MQDMIVFHVGIALIPPPKPPPFPLCREGPRPNELSLVLLAPVLFCKMPAGLPLRDAPLETRRKFVRWWPPGAFRPLDSRGGDGALAAAVDARLCAWDTGNKCQQGTSTTRQGHGRTSGIELGDGRGRMKVGAALSSPQPTLAIEVTISPSMVRLPIAADVDDVLVVGIARPIFLLLHDGFIKFM
jgi:hypothetical protein